jgi:hypothetical protein
MCYRLPLDYLQVAKVSRVLLAMEKGSLAAFKGKSLDEMDIPGITNTVAHFYQNLDLCVSVIYNFHSCDYFNNYKFYLQTGSRSMFQNVANI